MILLDGKKVSQRIIGEVKRDIETIGKLLKLAVIVVGYDEATENFIAQKIKTARGAGVEVILHRFESGIGEDELFLRVSEISNDENVHGVIVQLPLPPHIERQRILDAISLEKDVDVLSEPAVAAYASGAHHLMPPVAGAVKAFFKEYEIDYLHKKNAVAGAGELVGKPVTMWLNREGAEVIVITRESKNPAELLREADIIISGTGQAHWITGDMVKEGVIVIDAGSSELGGEIAGDVDFDTVAPKASYITPVPGGVGPVTVAVLLKNLYLLATKR